MPDLFQIDQQNVNLSMDSSLNNMNSQKSTAIKSNLTKKFITAKDPQIKERYYKEYEDNINLLSTILKQNKIKYYNHYLNPTATVWKIHGKG